MGFFNFFVGFLCEFFYCQPWIKWIYLDSVGFFFEVQDYLTTVVGFGRAKRPAVRSPSFLGSLICRTGLCRLPARSREDQT